MLHSGTWKRITAIVIAIVLVFGMFGNVFADDADMTGTVQENIAEGTIEEETVTEETVAEETAAEETTVAETTDEETAIEETTVEETAAEETTEQEIIAQEPTTEETQEEALPEKNDSVELMWNPTDVDGGDAVIGTSLYHLGSQERMLLKFVPANDGMLTVYSSVSSDVDTYGQILDSSKNVLEYDDDDGIDMNFHYEYQVEAGKVYYIAFRFYSSATSGDLTVTIEFDEINVKAGWVQVGDKWFYYQLSGGSLVRLESTWLNDNGTYYYFGSDGVMYASGVYWINDSAGGSYYGFDDSGHMLKGWYDFGGGQWYYFHSGGQAAEGLTIVNGKQYYFYEGEMISDISFIEDGKIIIIGANGVVTAIADAKAGWVPAGKDWYYFENNGSELEAVSSEWRTIGGQRYYFGYDSHMYADGIYWISSARYAFDANGHMVTGWYKEGIFWYYFNADGRMVYGLQTIGGKQYYLDYNEGYMLTAQTVNTGAEIFLIDKDGVVTQSAFADTNSWKKVGNYYYYALNGYFIKNQVRDIDGSTYRFDSEGRMLSNIVVELYYNSAWNYYGFDRSGRMVKGNWFQPDGGGGWYYFESSGKGAEGLKTINSRQYCFDHGRMLVSTKLAINGVFYIIDGAGHAAVYSGADGWIANNFYVKDGSPAQGWLKINGYWYYFNNGVPRRDGVSYVEEDGAYYYFDSSGAMKKGWIPVMDSWAFADTSGVLKTDGWMEIGSKKYYFDNYFAVTDIYDTGSGIELFNSDASWKETVNGASKWVQNDKYWYYVKAGGYIARNESLTINGSQYYFDSDGRMLTDYENNMSYYGSNGKMVRSAWVEIRSQWHYYDVTGIMICNSWKQIGSAKYYFDGGGNMVTGEYFIDGMVYNFGTNGKWDGKSGKIVRNGWLLADGYYYYFEDGYPAEGFREINGKTYYFDTYCHMYRDDNYEIDHAFYAFDQNGAMVKNSWYKNRSGEWVYAGSDGKLATGYTAVNGKYYYFLEGRYGEMATGGVLADNVYYDIASNGVVNRRITPAGTKWVKTSAGKWLYSRNGVFVTGLQSIDGAMYYFNESSGEMDKNKFVGSYSLTGGYCGSDGKVITEGWVRNSNGSWVYLVNGTALNGSNYINGKWYYFAVGSDQVFGTSDGIHYADGAFYKYAGSSGGRTKLSFGQGWNKYGNYWYYVAGTSLVRSVVRKIGSKYYLFDKTGKWVTTEEAVYYSGTKFLQKDGTFLKNSWKQIDGTWYYFGPDGNVWTGTRVINGKTYYLTTPKNKYVELG